MSIPTYFSCFFSFLNFEKCGVRMKHVLFHMKIPCLYIFMTSFLCSVSVMESHSIFEYKEKSLTGRVEYQRTVLFESWNLGS